MSLSCLLFFHYANELALSFSFLNVPLRLIFHALKLVDACLQLNDLMLLFLALMLSLDHGAKDLGLY